MAQVVDFFVSLHFYRFDFFTLKLLDSLSSFSFRFSVRSCIFNLLFIVLSFQFLMSSFSSFLSHKSF